MFNCYIKRENKFRSLLHITQEKSFVALLTAQVKCNFGNSSALNSIRDNHIYSKTSRTDLTIDRQSKL